MKALRLGGGAVALAVLFISGAHAQEKQTPPGLASIEQRVDAFIGKLDAARKEKGVVGAAIVVADGDRVVRIAGLGARDLKSGAPVTEDTVFPMASVTKQFTAVAVALTVSEGKMRFEDHPRRFVPSIRLQDPEADAKLNMIDLLAHRSGLDRSDFPWLLSPFTPQEMFELAYRARPVGKLREQFLYNATMYALAGAAVAGAQGTTYERFMTERLLGPLGMKSSTLTLAGLTGAANRATGYKPGGEASEAVMPIDLASIAPGGSLNSTARDMGAWLRFLNARGRIGGKTVIAPAVFARLFERHQAVAPGFDAAPRLLPALQGRAGRRARRQRSGLHRQGRSPAGARAVVRAPDQPGRLGARRHRASPAARGRGGAGEEPRRLRRPRPRALRPPPRATPSRRPSRLPQDELVGLYHSTQAGELEVKKSGSGLVVVFAKAAALPAGRNGGEQIRPVRAPRLLRSHSASRSTGCRAASRRSCASRPRTRRATSPS